MQAKNGCEKSKYPPNGNRFEEAKCRDLWERAKTEHAKKSTEISFEMASQIHVRTETDDQICYNQKNLKTKGWCKISGERNKNAWGVCSSSCSYFVSSYRLI